MMSPFTQKCSARRWHRFIRICADNPTKPWKSVPSASSYLYLID